MSAETNRELARRFVEEILIREDAAAVEELVGDPILARGLLTGMSEPKEHRPFTEDRVAYEEIVADDETAIVIVQATNRHTGDWPTERFGVVPPTWRTVTVPLVFVLKISDGKVVAFRDYADLYGLLDQVGAIPEPVQPEPAAVFEFVPAAETETAALPAAEQ